MTMKELIHFLPIAWLRSKIVGFQLSEQFQSKMVKETIYCYHIDAIDFKNICIIKDYSTQDVHGLA